MFVLRFYNRTFVCTCQEEKIEKVPLFGHVSRRSDSQKEGLFLNFCLFCFGAAAQQLAQDEQPHGCYKNRACDAVEYASAHAVE